jgi:hypothetical protein
MLGRFTVRPSNDGDGTYGVWDGAVNGWRASGLTDSATAEQIEVDLDLQFDAHGPRPACPSLPVANREQRLRFGSSELHRCRTSLTANITETRRARPDDRPRAGPMRTLALDKDGASLARCCPHGGPGQNVNPCDSVLPQESRFEPTGGEIPLQDG